MKTLLFTTITIGVTQLSGCGQQKEPEGRNEEEHRSPNILFAISDDHSYHTSFTGTKFVNTPAFDRIAREGVFLTNCIAASPACAPTRSSIVTGRHHWQNEQSGQHASSWMKKHVPFIDLLDENGYATGMTGKGVAPFQYARDENDSLWRATNAAGIARSNIRYTPGSPDDERTANAISTVNYFENFKYFMENVRDDKPFFFWYGASEPHRPYEKDSWKRAGKKLEDVEVPSFLPDNEIIRGDLLDYAIEVEWFDLHLERMINYLEQVGELDNTIIIVTADQGMPFTHAKTNCYNYGIHVPFAIRYPGRIPGGRMVDDVVSFIDIAPTILDFTRTNARGMLPITGNSLVDILTSEKEGTIDKNNKYAFAGIERHGSARYQNLGYPRRAIRSSDFLFIWNIKPDRWPVGSPQKVKRDSDGELLPLFGLDENGKYIGSAAFFDIAEGPTKRFLIENWDKKEISPFFALAFLKRPEFEFFDIRNDPECLNNLIDEPGFERTIEEMKDLLMKELRDTNDPRVIGPDKEVFDSYIRYSIIRNFPETIKY